MALSSSSLVSGVVEEEEGVAWLYCIRNPSIVTRVYISDIICMYDVSTHMIIKAYSGVLCPRSWRQAMKRVEVVLLYY